MAPCRVAHNILGESKAFLFEADSFYLAKCNLVLCPVVKLGCSRRLMSDHLLVRSRDLRGEIPEAANETARFSTVFH